MFRSLTIEATTLYVILIAVWSFEIVEKAHELT